MTFTERMEDNVRYNLIFPYHTIGAKFPEEKHSHSFENILQIVYEFANIFYLTDEDKKYYSQQELTFIEKIQELEKEKINKGWEMVSLDISEETEVMLSQYMVKHNMTYEESIVDILKKMIKECEGQNNGYL